MEMDELDYTIDDVGALVKKVSIKKIKPCIAAEGKIRVLMQTDAELEDLIPYLVSRYPPGKVNYIERKKILTLTLHNRLITLYPSGKISMNKTRDKEEAIEVIAQVIGDMNHVYLEIQEGGTEDYSKIKDKLSHIGPLAIYNCLPQTNCGDCGQATCMAFAVRLLAGETTLDQCTPLYDSQNVSKVKCLEELLGSQIMHTLGWKD